MFTLSIAILLTVLVLLVWAIREVRYYGLGRLYGDPPAASQRYTFIDRVLTVIEGLILRSPFIGALAAIWLWIA